MRYSNNPLNIRYDRHNRWIGQLGADNGFCTFDTLEHGIRAAAYLLMISYRRAGCKTYHQIISRWAPFSENATYVYLSFICKKLHVFPFDVPSTIGNFCGLIHYMWLFEQGSCVGVYNSAWILRIINKYHLKIYER